MSLVERKRREAVDELVETAIELFETDGFEATTVEAIAEAAGCSPRTFYRYFGSKEDVTFHDVPEVIGRLGAALTERLDRGMEPWPALAEAVQEILGRPEVDQRSIPVRRMELWLSEPALRTRYMQHLRAAEQEIVETLARSRGTNPDDDDLAHLMAIAAIGAYRTTMTTHGTARVDEKLAAHLDSLLDVYGRGLEGVALGG